MELPDESVRGELKFGYQVFFGKESNINIVGKILLFPLIIPVLGIMAVLDLLFTKSKW